MSELSELAHIFAPMFIAAFILDAAIVIGVLVWAKRRQRD